MNEVAEREGFLVAYPNAVNGDWTVSDDHNIGFVETLLDTLSDDYFVDSRRVYATGASQGGIMSFVVSSALADRFAAIAPLAGLRANSDAANRQPAFLANTPERPFPLLYVHGTADTVVPYDGGVSSSDESLVFPAVSEVLDEWVDNNGGTLLEQVSMIPGFNVTDGPAVSLFQCSDCGSYINAAGNQLPAELIHMRVNGVGHVWPDPDIIDVSAETWNFFRRHERAAIPEPVSSRLMLLGLSFVLLHLRCRGYSRESR
jgi:polyhydroxybutyrate depolymerase